MQNPIAKRLRRIDLIFAAVLFALIGGTVGMGIIPLYKARAHNLSKSLELQAEINSLGDLNLSIGRAEADVKLAEARLASEEARLPNTQTMDQFMTELAKVADTAGLQVDALGPKPTIDAGTYKVVPVRISGVGSYDTCYKFLTGLGNMTRLTRLDELQLQVKRDEHADVRNPICEITVSISTFVVR